MAGKRKKFIILAVAAALLIALVVWVLWGNTALEVNTITVSSDRLPEAFDGYRIAHLSDLHNTEMGKDNETLLALLRDAAPDIICITGDMIDSRNTDIAVAVRFAEEAAKIAPCYYVMGNHEARIPGYQELKKGLMAAGVTVLENEKAEIRLQNETITLMGVIDPSAHSDLVFGKPEAIMRERLTRLCEKDDGFTVLLSHRPELFDVYAEFGLDLVLSGHAHGGQFRLPFVGGLAAPDQGLFPEYDAGLYTEGSTNMVVSRGIGNSIIPVRINNRPEVIIIELHLPGKG